MQALHAFCKKNQLKLKSYARETLKPSFMNQYIILTRRGVYYIHNIILCKYSFNTQRETLAFMGSFSALKRIL